jgi:iron complex transport system ATP-binding protein
MRCPRRRARRVAWLPHRGKSPGPSLWKPSSCWAVCRTCRAASDPGPEDEAAVEDALAAMDLAAFAQRAATELSGGEQARVLIARALAQDTPLILADEPTAGLDPGHQIGTLERFGDLARTANRCSSRSTTWGWPRAIAAACPDGSGPDRRRWPADEVLSPERLADVFGIRAHLSRGADGLVFQPLSVIP